MYQVHRYKNTKFFAVTTSTGQLVAVCVYKKGAEEVKDLLNRLTKQQPNGHQEKPGGRFLFKEAIQ